MVHHRADCAYWQEQLPRLFEAAPHVEVGAHRGRRANRRRHPRTARGASRWPDQRDVRRRGIPAESVGTCLLPSVGHPVASGASQAPRTGLLARIGLALASGCHVAVATEVAARIRRVNGAAATIPRRRRAVRRLPGVHARLRPSQPSGGEWRRSSGRRRARFTTSARSGDPASLKRGQRCARTRSFPRRRPAGRPSTGALAAGAALPRAQPRAAVAGHGRHDGGAAGNSAPGRRWCRSR